jgi:hypothetical protein
VDGTEVPASDHGEFHRLSFMSRNEKGGAGPAGNDARPDFTVATI